MILAKLTVKPKRKPNLVRWMNKHGVSTTHTSIAFGTVRAVEWEALNKNK